MSELEKQDKPNIWIDADACPVAIKEILIRAADRTQIRTTFIANQAIKVPSSPFVASLQVMPGFDVADNEIVKRVQAGDLVITQDIPLADEVLTKGAEVINTRGERLTKNNIKARLNIRDFLETMRSSGIQTGGPAAFGQGERKLFADNLDKWLTRIKNKIAKPT